MPNNLILPKVERLPKKIVCWLRGRYQRLNLWRRRNWRRQFALFSYRRLAWAIQAIIIVAVVAFAPGDLKLRAGVLPELITFKSSR